MKFRLFKDSMQLKLVLIYCLLVFIATTVIGVLIMSQLESYYMNSTKQNIIKSVKEGMISSLSTYSSLAGSRDEIKDNVDAWSKTIQGEFFVVDEGLEIIASNSAVLKVRMLWMRWIRALFILRFLTTKMRFRIAWCKTRQ